MTKDSGKKSALAQTEQTKDQQKKQAKKEAKMMLAIEQVKSSLVKAQGKLAKAQARVEARTSHLHNLETELATARSTSPETPVEAPDNGFDHQGEQADTQELATSSSDGENHTSAAHIESETASNAAPQKTGDTSVAAQATAMEPVNSDQESGETTSAKTPARRTTTRKPASTTKTPPEASNGNSSDSE